MPLSEDCDVFWEPSLKSSPSRFGLIDRRLSEGMDQGVCDLGASCSFADLSQNWMRSISHSFGSHLKLFLSERTVRGGIWEVRKECPKRFLGRKKSTCSPLFESIDSMFIAAAAWMWYRGEKGFYPPPFFWRVAIVSTLTGFYLITLRINWGPLIYEDSIGDDKVYIFYRCAHSLRL